MQIFESSQVVPPRLKYIAAQGRQQVELFADCESFEDRLKRWNDEESPANKRRREVAASVKATEAASAAAAALSTVRHLRWLFGERPRETNVAPTMSNLLAPIHVVTGPLRRPPEQPGAFGLTGVWPGYVELMKALMLSEEQTIDARSEAWKRARFCRPAEIDVESWEAHIVEAMQHRTDPQDVISLLAGIALHEGVEWPPRVYELGCWEAFLAASDGWDAESIALAVDSTSDTNAAVVELGGGL